MVSFLYKNSFLVFPSFEGLGPKLSEEFTRVFTVWPQFTFQLVTPPSPSFILLSYQKEHPRTPKDHSEWRGLFLKNYFIMEMFKHTEAERVKWWTFMYHHPALIHSQSCPLHAHPTWDYFKANLRLYIFLIWKYFRCISERWGQGFFFFFFWDSRFVF